MILTATQAESKEVSCQTVERLTDQGSFDLTAILSVDKGRIENVALEQTIAPRNPSKAGYTCRANVANGVPNSHWETRGDKTIVSIAPDEMGEPSSLTIIKVKRGYVLKKKSLKSRVRRPDGMARASFYSCAGWRASNLRAACIVASVSSASWPPSDRSVILPNRALRHESPV